MLCTFEHSWTPCCHGIAAARIPPHTLRHLHIGRTLAYVAWTWLLEIAMICYAHNIHNILFSALWLAIYEARCFAYLQHFTAKASLWFEWLQESNTKHRQTQRCWHLPKTTRWGYWWPRLDPVPAPREKPFPANGCLNQGYQYVIGCTCENIVWHTDISYINLAGWLQHLKILSLSCQTLTSTRRKQMACAPIPCQHLRKS